MVAIVVTGILTISAIVIVPNITYGNLLYVNQQQLRNLASETLKTMLLDAGYPAKWGSYQTFTNSTIQRFGLALVNSASFYVLDPDKVSRLIVDNPAGHIGYETVRDRLKLQGSGFNFRIIAPFNVTVTNLSQLNNLKFSVRVAYHDGSPIPNANLDANIIYVLSTDDKTYYFEKASNKTDALGRSEISKTLPSRVSDYMVVFKVTVANVSTMIASFLQGFHQHVVSASIVGNNVTLQIPQKDMPGGDDPSGVRWIHDVMSVTEDGVWDMYQGTGGNEDKITYGKGYYSWSRTFEGLYEDSPLFLIFSISVPLGEGQGGRQLVLFAGPYPNVLGSRVQAYGDPTGGSKGASAAVKIQRDVIISDMLYIAELTLWKESP